MAALTEQQIINIVQQVYDMREAQKAYFKHRNDAGLKLSIAKESTVDNTVEWFIKQGLITRKSPPPPAPKLFV